MQVPVPPREEPGYPHSVTQISHENDGAVRTSRVRYVWAELVLPRPVATAGPADRLAEIPRRFVDEVVVPRVVQRLVVSHPPDQHVGERIERLHREVPVPFRRPAIH